MAVVQTIYRKESITVTPKRPLVERTFKRAFLQRVFTEILPPWDFPSVPRPIPVRQTIFQRSPVQFVYKKEFVPRSVKRQEEQRVVYKTKPCE